MAYAYYCMRCGKELSQETVLFDMQYLLTRDKEKKFQLLKFRLTQKELMKLIQSGQEGESGFRKCTISFKEIMAFIGNANNLNAGKVYTDAEGNKASDNDIAGLTLAQIDEYLSEDDFSGKKKKKEEEDDPFGEWDDIPNEGDEERKAEKEAAKRAAAAIFALEAKDETNTDKSYTKFILRPDLQILRGLFAQGDTFTFSIKEQIEQDNEGKDVLVGYDLSFGGNIGHLSIDARVCDKCGSKVFTHAGTAKHQAVAFIGYQSAGKTSTILSLAHFAANHMTRDLSGMGDKASDIWAGMDVFKGVEVERVDEDDPRLQEDLNNFTEGVAPNKTEASKREDAYCATFRIKNKLQNKYYLFTLTDLPGELCRTDGTIDKERVHNHFPVALTCDAFVACFDTSSLNPTGTGGLSKWIDNVCRWTEAFQQMRADNNLVKTYVPTMLLFTKCKELENGEEPVLNSSVFVPPVQKMFYLYREKECIEKNKLYNAVIDAFNGAGQLPKAYHAMMRCSPFGYKAPSKNDLNGPNKDQFHNETPKPKNIDKLMYWLLCVSGCIPADLSYTVPGRDGTYSQSDYYLVRPQLRSEAPLAGHELEESMVRCFLFENFSEYDKDFVEHYDSKAGLVMAKFKARLHLK